MSYTDFIITALNPAAYLGEPLDSGFKYFDSADKGFLTVDDVRKVFTKSGKQVMDDDIMQLIQVYDTNKDGKLDFEEFSAMIQGRTGTNKIQTDGKVR